MVNHGILTARRTRRGGVRRARKEVDEQRQSVDAALAREEKGESCIAYTMSEGHETDHKKLADATLQEQDHH